MSNTILPKLYCICKNDCKSGTILFSSNSKELVLFMQDKSLPLYKEVANKLKKDIISVKSSKGDMIPTEAKIAQVYQVSRVTVRRAIKLLEEENLVYSIQGSGTYIKNDKIEYDIFKLQSFTAEMIERGTDFSNEILEFQLTQPPKNVQEILNLSNNEKIYYVKRLRFVNGEPCILEESHLPANLFPGLSVDIMKNSLYEYHKNRGYDINYREGELLPVSPKKDLIRLLHLENNDPILFLKMHTAFEKGEIFEFTKIYFHPHKYAFKFISSTKE